MSLSIRPTASNRHLTADQHMALSVGRASDRPQVDLDDSRHFQRVCKGGLRLHKAVHRNYMSTSLYPALQFTTVTVMHESVEKTSVTTSLGRR